MGSVVKTIGSIAGTVLGGPIGSIVGSLAGNVLSSIGGGGGGDIIGDIGKALGGLFGQQPSPAFNPAQAPAPFSNSTSWAGGAAGGGTNFSGLESQFQSASQGLTAAAQSGDPVQMMSAQQQMQKVEMMIETMSKIIQMQAEAQKQAIQALQ